MALEMGNWFRTPTSGVITLLITGRGQLCGIFLFTLTELAGYLGVVFCRMLLWNLSLVLWEHLLKIFSHGMWHIGKPLSPKEAGTAVDTKPILHGQYLTHDGKK